VELAPGRTLRFIGLNSALICSTTDEEGRLLLGLVSMFCLEMKGKNWWSYVIIRFIGFKIPTKRDDMYAAERACSSRVTSTAPPWLSKTSKTDAI
jgi:hypothetical protein